MAGAQSLSPEEKARRIEEARKKAEEIKRQREASGQSAASTTPAPPQAHSPEERQRRIEEAKRKSEEAKAQKAAAAVPPKPKAPAPQAVPKVLPLALKEWAVALRALEQGKQVILFRKGGILDRDFRIMRDEFALLPTHEHQDEKLLKPAHKGLLQEVGNSPSDGSRVVVSSWARLFDFIPVRNLDKLVQLDEYHIFSKAYVEQRHKYRIDKPTNVLFLRVYKLPEAVALELTPEQAGCRSWVPMEVKVPPGAIPVLEDEEFRSRVEEIATIIS
jgi:hypothetical protein